MKKPDKSLNFSEFPPLSKAEWLEKVKQDQKGKAFSELSWTPEPNIHVDPFYMAEDLPGPISDIDEAPGSGSMRRGNIFNQEVPGWQMVQAVNMDHPAAAEQIEQATMAEVSAFYAFGSQLNSSVLKKLNLGQQALHLDISENPLLLFSDLAMNLAENGAKPSHLTGTLWADPLSRFAKKGTVPDELDWMNWNSGMKQALRYPWFRAWGIDLSYVHNLGGAICHELAFCLSSIVAYLDRKDPAISLEDMMDNLAIQLSVGSLFFPELAKFRALRILINKLMEAYGVSDPAKCSPFVLATTSRRTQTIYDPHNNLLRATTQATSAVLGGANAILVQEYDHLNPLESGDSPRLARNIQLLLKHESYMDQVGDPAGGSYYIEILTEQLAEEAWALFQELEAAGGFVQAVENQLIPAMMEAYSEIQAEAYAWRKASIVGINDYANIQDNPGKPNMDIAGLRREAAPFEALRQKMQNQPTAGKALMLGFGKPKMMHARKQFVSNLMACGGWELESLDLNQQAGAFPALSEANSVQLIILCADNEAYLNQGPKIIEQIRAAHPNLPIMLAGNPEGMDSLKVDECIHKDMDALSFLTHISETLILKNSR